MTHLSIAIPFESKLDGFPAIVSPREGDDDSASALVQLIEDHREWIKGQVLESGALLLRGWKLRHGQDFASAVETLGYTNMDYKHGIASRKHVFGPVFTANENPVELPVHPDIVIFFFEQPSPQGGGTALVHGGVLYERLAKEMPEFLERLEEKKIRYLTLHKNWEQAFDTTDKVLSQERARAMSVRLEWKNDGSDEVIAHRGPFSPCLKHPVKSTTAWFNSMLLIRDDPQNRTKVETGDGNLITSDELQKLDLLAQEEKAVVEWQTGDVVIVDNLSVMHSRLPGIQPRVILVSLAKA